MPVLGSDKHIGMLHNDIFFLDIIEFLGNFDQIIQEHIQNVQNKEIHDHYLGKNIQNELIDMGKTVQK